MAEVNPVIPDVEDGRAEVSAVLSSSLFQRSRAGRLLEYLCDKLFTGRAGEIKEYNIALDVLGRPETFDPADDASARVEIHRLRKKLKEYYESEGRDHLLRIVIPSGSYIPGFVPREDAPGPDIVLPSAPAPANIVSTPPSLFEPVGNGPARRTWISLVTVALLASAATWAAIRFRVAESAVHAVNSRRSNRAIAAPVPSGAAIRILCGRPEPLADGGGSAWKADAWFTGGTASVITVPDHFARTRTPGLFAGRRTGNFSYDIPLARGTYELRLYFAESEYGPGMPKGGGENSRVFHVLANGHRILSDFDVLADARGPEIADVRAFKDIQPDSDGKLHLRFITSVGDALVNAIEIAPARPHLLNPIRMTAQDSAYTDSAGNRWMPDDFRTGGRTAAHSAPVSAAKDRNLYLTERYGHFDYAIPVPPGSYDVVVHTAETYWGPENPGGNGPGTRVFDIFCNGVALVRGLDIYSRTGANHALPLRFEALQPNAQGKLMLDFVPAKNYASVFAIEVIDVSE